MAIVTVNDESLYDIGDSIRAKLGVQTTYLPSEMAAAIDTISSGGGGGGADGVFVGEADPTSNIGSNGDTYFQYMAKPGAIVTDGSSCVSIGQRKYRSTSYGFEVEIAIDSSSVINSGSLLLGFFVSGAIGNYGLRIDNDILYAVHAGKFNSYSSEATASTLVTTTDLMTRFYKIKVDCASGNVQNTSYTVDVSVDDSVVSSLTYTAQTTYADDCYFLLFGATDNRETTGTPIFAPSGVKVKSFRLFDTNGDVVRLVPGFDASSNPTMVDEISKQALTNLGSGSFSYDAGVGKVLKKTWVKSSGTWAVV